MLVTLQQGSRLHKWSSLVGCYEILLGFTKLCWMLPNFVGFYQEISLYIATSRQMLPYLVGFYHQILLDFTKSCWILPPNLVGFYHQILFDLPNLVGFYHQILLDFTKSCWILPNLVLRWWLSGWQNINLTNQTFVKPCSVLSNLVGFHQTMTYFYQALLDLTRPCWILFNLLGFDQSWYFLHARGKWP